MSRTGALLLAAAIFSLASPALADDPGPWRARQSAWASSWNPWTEPWACSAFEYAKRCNAQLTPRWQRCQCVPDGGHLGRRIDEYYGPGARNLAPRDGGP